MGAASFDPRRLTLARRAAGLTKRDLADRTGISAPSVSQYEAGNTEPGIAVLRRAALVVGVPVEYFFATGLRRRPQFETRSFFRSLRSTKQWERDQADARAEHVADVVASVELRLKLPPLEVPDLRPPGPRPSRTALEDIAARTRSAWDMPAGPVSNVVRWLEVKGVVVARLPSTSSRLDAFSRWFETRPIVLLWDGKDDKARSRFDAAHELGHLVMHQEPEPGDQVQERQAHSFAAAFLMPAAQIVGELPRRLTRPSPWDELFALRKRWGVSAAALLYRSRELRVLTESQFRRGMTQLSAWGMRRDEGDDLGPPERPALLASALRKLVDERGLTATELASELRFSDRMLAEVVGELGDKPPALSVESPRDELDEWRRRRAASG